MPIIFQSFQAIWMEFGILLRLVDVMNLILNLCHPFNIQGKETYWCDFVFKKNAFACIQALTDQFFSNYEKL